MILADKTIWIQYYQYKYSQWLVTFNKRLEIGIVKPCDFKTNILISNFINVLYRHDTDEENLPTCLTDEEICDIILRLKLLLKDVC